VPPSNTGYLYSSCPLCTCRVPRFSPPWITHQFKKNVTALNWQTRRLPRKSTFPYPNYNIPGRSTTNPDLYSMASPLGQKRSHSPDLETLDETPAHVEPEKTDTSNTDQTKTAAPASMKSTPASSYTCPICLSPPRMATLTPCGHILCASCLWDSVRSARARELDAPPLLGVNASRCPVCREILKGWDWKGGGIIGLEMKVK